LRLYRRPGGQSSVGPTSKDWFPFSNIIKVKGLVVAGAVKFRPFYLIENQCVMVDWKNNLKIMQNKFGLLK